MRPICVPIERESEIKCDFICCYAGMGLAGNGVCFAGGNPYVTECPEFKDEEEWLREQEADHE